MVGIVIGADQRGFRLKEFLKTALEGTHNFIDVGSFDENSIDYPDMVLDAVKKLEVNPQTVGILICGSGIGVAIAANRYKFIRAALVRDQESAVSAKEHNNANVICLAADKTLPKDALGLVKLFLDAKFLEGRHLSRVEKLQKLGG